MAHLCINESTKRNMSKPRENANQPLSFVVFTKSMFQLISAGGIIGGVQVIDLLVFIDIVILKLQDNNVKNSYSWVFFWPMVNIISHISMCNKEKIYT